uniref:Uncharacterized protein n=1 Tax=Arundo donax TaxID=35708 RepID=A0A0A8Z5B7_ARUDO
MQMYQWCLETAPRFVGCASSWTPMYYRFCLTQMEGYNQQ